MIPFLHRLRRPTAEENPLWLVVLCDLMTNLMLFFLVMYSFTLQNAKTKTQWLRAFDASRLIEPRHDKAEALIREFKENEAAGAVGGLLQKAGLSDLTDVAVTERSIRVRLRNQLLFGTAQAELNEEASRTLGQLAGVLKQIPNEILVEGHTDDVPIAAGLFQTNWELSVARSYAVIELFAREGIDNTRLIAAGYGPYHPIAPNSAPGGRALNRRVEVVILRGAESSDE